MIGIINKSTGKRFLKEQCEMINRRQMNMQMTNNVHMINYV